MRILFVREEGGASVVAIAIVLAVTLLTGAFVMTHALFVTHRQVAGTADNAALAAADVAAGFVFGSPCESAAQIAIRNRATIESCTVDGFHVHVSVSRYIMGITVRVSANAGPPHPL
ncbi:Rv3654c family TadE-like protein [Lysinibacter sp. HNR]|uniref:Rv3654c family TadE-like protein n=1 Tax=Lysinibacter sp. HNR TaxID=3031408 RepID=UPI002435A3F0|nr:Rv3654c family TadE-like protein [Lysinibacter sp. HNR]WGD37077.1 flp pilus-assembly TadE/G-like family protein [Lysinibacter sp. HNR]